VASANASCEASGLALPLARFMLRSLYDCLAQRRGWGGTVGLSAQARADLRWWARMSSNHEAIGRAIWRPPDTRELWTDASGLGWGGALPQRLRHAPAVGFWSPEELPLHINHKELVAVRLSVQHFLPQLVGHRVLLHCDNTAVCWIITNFVSRSPALMRELRTLWGLLSLHDISLRPVYIRSADNKVADAASRMAMPRDYCLERSVFERVQRAWGWCTVDAFASPATAQLPRFWTAADGHGGEARDAFAQQWRGERLWLHPPAAMLPAVVQMLDATGVEAHICTPRWPAAAWYGMLRDRSSEYMHVVPGSLRPIAGDAPSRLRAWPLTIFRVGGRGTH